jgi:hypothetical protein
MLFINYKKSITTLLVSIGKTSEFNLPWGDNFIVNNEVKWGFTKTAPVGHEITKFEKIKLLKKYIDKNGPIPLRVCWKKPNMFNCNKCEKCVRTMLSLMITGVDPEQVGFKVKDPKVFLKNLKNGLKSFNFDELSAYFWRDVQKHLPNTLEFYPQYLRNFLVWFKNYRIIERKNRIKIYMIRMISTIIPSLLCDRLKMLVKNKLFKMFSTQLDMDLILHNGLNEQE